MLVCIDDGPHTLQDFIDLFALQQGTQNFQSTDTKFLFTRWTKQGNPLKQDVSNINKFFPTEI